MNMLAGYVCASYAYMIFDGLVITQVQNHECAPDCMCPSYYICTAFAPFTAPIIISKRIRDLLRR